MLLLRLFSLSHSRSRSRSITLTHSQTHSHSRPTGKDELNWLARARVDVDDDARRPPKRLRAPPFLPRAVRGGACVAARAPAINPLGGVSIMSQRTVEPFVAVVRFGAWWH